MQECMGLGSACLHHLMVLSSKRLPAGGHPVVRTVNSARVGSLLPPFVRAVGAQALCTPTAWHDAVAMWHIAGRVWADECADEPWLQCCHADGALLAGEPLCSELTVQSQHAAQLHQTACRLVLAVTAME
jgi:hypothetical protein